MRTLLLCSRPPWPPIGGDRLRTSHLARALGQLGPVRLVAAGDAADPPPWFESVTLIPPSRRGAVTALARGLAGGASLQEAVYATDAARDAVSEALAGVDLVVAHLVRTVPWLPEQTPPVIVCLQDALAEQAREATAAPGRAGGWRRTALGLDAGRLAEAEERALARSDAVTFITARDRDLVLRGRPHPHAVVPAAVERIANAPAEPEPDTMVFSGNLRTASNQDMALHLARDVLPRVRARRPNARLDLVGIEAPPVLRRLREPGVRLVGAVDDMHATLARAWVTAAPLRFGSGVQNKVLESFAAGTPVVGTSRVAASLEPGSGLVVADGAEGLAAALAGVLEDRERRTALGAEGLAFVRRHHAYPTALEPLLALARDLVRAP